MENIEFIYNGNSTIIQCNLNDKLEDICKKYATKIQVDLKELLFLYMGNKLNFDLELNKLKVNTEKIKILVYDYEEKLSLKFNLKDINNNIYVISMDFSQDLDITAECGGQSSQKMFKNSFSLEDLKKKSKFFKIYDTVEESYGDIKLFSDQNSFFIQSNEKSLYLGIKKQIGIAYDILFLLKEENLLDKLNIEIEKNKQLNQEINDLKTLIKQKDKIIDDKNVIIQNLEKEINQLKNNKNSELIDKKKEKQIKDLDSILPFKISKGEKIMTVVFSSLNEDILYPVICKNTDLFNRLEYLLYEEYPHYAEKEICFKHCGYKINKFKTLEENKIRDKSIIDLIFYDDE